MSRNSTRKARSKPKARARAAPATKAAPLSLRAYAKRRGVSAEAVSKAITTGRLSKSVATVAGKPKIADPELADREWDANTQQRVDQQAAAPRDPPEYLAHRTAREGAAARRELAQARLAELELAEREGEFIKIADARRDVMEKFTLVRTQLLGIPARLVQRMPDISEEVVDLLDELLREALEELADGDPAAADLEEEVDEPAAELARPAPAPAPPAAEVERDDQGDDEVG